MGSQQIRQRLERQKGQQIQIQNTLTSLRTEIKLKQKELERHEEAKEIVRAAGQKTQEAISYHLSDITSLAMDAIFTNPYELVVEFVQRRNKTECDLFFRRNGQNADPMDSTGGGDVDVASFALRIACWAMNRPRTSNTIILDEPFHFLSEDLQEKASAMLKEVSKKLKIQFIIVTHKDNLTAYGDRVFQTYQKKYKEWDVSIVKEIVL